jgi:hypothetical protein
MFRNEYEDFIRQQHELEVEAEKQRMIGAFKSKSSRSRDIRERFGKLLIAAGEKLMSNQASISQQPEFQLRR